MKKRLAISAAALLISGQCLACIVSAAEHDSTYIVLLEDGSVSPSDAAEYITSKLPTCDVGYRYDTLIRGFELTLPDTLAGYIASLDFVDSIYEIGSYQTLETDAMSGIDAVYGADAMSDAGTASDAARSDETASDTETVEYTNGYTAAVESARELVGLDDLSSEYGLTGDGVLVAVIDSNFDIDHPAFAGETATEVYTEESIAALLDTTRLNVNNYASSEELYYKERIPFAFDYSGRDTDLSGSASHGTHVAGIIGANPTDDSSMQGIAPECQLLLMKVFSDDGETADDAAILAALEDAVSLGADVINLSLGSYSGSAAAKSSRTLEAALKKAEDAGCAVVSASGNEATSAQYSRFAYEYDVSLPPADYTDYGTAGYPSVSEYSLATASVDNMYSFGTAFGFENGGELFSYTDTNLMFSLLDETFAEHFGNRGIEFAVVPGIGLDSDYDGVDVRGKLALISRGETTFAEKTAVAASNGAVGVIFYNNVENEIMNLDLTDASLPAIAISLEDGERLIEDSRRELRFYPSSSFKVENGGLPSFFSSTGATPQLGLKPDISAVGGNIYSAIPDGYGTMSGTSMASPQLAGIIALLCEYYADSADYAQTDNQQTTDIQATDTQTTDTQATDTQTTDTQTTDTHATDTQMIHPQMIRTLLMNSAQPLLGPDGVEYSPRLQGAGLVNLGSALDCELELTYAYNGKPKIELYDLIGDHIRIDIALTNLTDAPLDVALSASLINDGYEAHEIDGELKYFSSLVSTPDSKSIISVGQESNLNRSADNYAPYALTLDAHESRTVSLTIELDSDYSEKLASIFTNGYFVEGYIYCETANHRCSIPYMGYAGDWTSAPILDASVYTESTYQADAPSNESAISQPVFGGVSIVTPVLERYITAGLDIFSDDLSGTNIPAADEIAFSPNGDGAADYIYLRADFLRNASSGSMTVLDSEGKAVYTSLAAPNYFIKSHDYEAPVALLFEWNGSDGINLRYILPDGRYTLRYDFTLDYLSGVTQTYTFDIRLDTEKPSVDSYSYDADSGILTLTASDNHKPRYVKLFSDDSEDFRLIEYCPGIDEGSSFTAEFDLSGYDGDSIYVEIVDCAYNSLVDIIELGVSE